MAAIGERPDLKALRPEDRPLDWGTEREMNGLEALMWRAEADPRLRSTICALEELERPSGRPSNSTASHSARARSNGVIAICSAAPSSSVNPAPSGSRTRRTW